MKFKDLPQLTNLGSYRIDVPLNNFEDNMQRFIDKYNLQLNPDFQREHVWDEYKQVKYVEYLLSGGTSGRELYFNQPGWMGDFKGDFVVVDGKQRIQAIMRFLKNEIKVFNTYYKDFEDKIPYKYSVLININNLKTRKEVLKWYLEMNSGGVVHTEEELNKVKLMMEKEEKTK